jgi:hypothetical protein
MYIVVSKRYWLKPVLLGSLYLLNWQQVPTYLCAFLVTETEWTPIYMYGGVRENITKSVSPWTCF